MTDTQTSNPMPAAGALVPISRGELAASAVATKAAAAVQARYVMALQRPRNMEDVRTKLLRECKRPFFAEVARYNKPIGKGVEGPSIRFAETAARLMGNILVDQPVIYDDEEKRIINVTVSDLETNTTYNREVTVTKTVERLNVKEGTEVLRTRINSRGKTLYVIQASDDDLINREAALVSKALRTLLLRLIPGDLVDEAMEQVLETRKAKDAADPDAARRRVFDGMAQLGILPSDIEKYLGHPSAQITPAEVVKLRDLYVAIRDGEATWVDALEAAGKKTAEEQQATAEPTKTSKTAELLEQRRKGQQAAPAPAVSPSSNVPSDEAALEKAEKEAAQAASSSREQREAEFKAKHRKDAKRNADLLDHDPNTGEVFDQRQPAGADD